MARKFSWILPAALLLLLAQLSACRHEYKATAPLPDGGSATLAVRPMFGPGSDWHRRLLIRTAADPDHPLSVDLFPDSGWWRGSNLYLLAPGQYVLHEGQDGCVAFTTHPRPAMTTAKTKGPAYSCDKAAAPGLVRASMQNGHAASRFYRGLFYIGHFAETAEGEPVQFVTAKSLRNLNFPTGCDAKAGAAFAAPALFPVANAREKGGGQITASMVRSRSSKLAVSEMPKPSMAL